MSTAVLEDEPIVAVEPVPIRWGCSSFFTQVSVLTVRSIRSMITDPARVIFGLVQPLLTLFVFTQIFGSVSLATALPPGTTYLDFLMPAILVNHVVQASTSTGIGLVEDLRNGLVPRLRSMPVSGNALLLARSLADLARLFVQIVAIIFVAMVVLGFRPAGGATGLLLSALLTLAVGWGLSWVFLAFATYIRSGETIQGLSVLVMMPLMFVSSAFVPIAQLPGWIRPLAQINPLTYAIDACRALALNLDGGVAAALLSVVISIALTVVSVAVAGRGFARPL